MDLTPVSASAHCVIFLCTAQCSSHKNVKNNYIFSSSMGTIAVQHLAMIRLDSTNKTIDPPTRPPTHAHLVRYLNRGSSQKARACTGRFPLVFHNMLRKQFSGKGGVALFQGSGAKVDRGSWFRPCTHCLTETGYRCPLDLSLDPLPLGNWSLFLSIRVTASSTRLVFTAR